MSNRHSALEALYRVCLETIAAPYRSERGRIVGYTLTRKAANRIREAVSAVTKADIAIRNAIQDAGKQNVVPADPEHPCWDCFYEKTDYSVCDECEGTGDCWRTRLDGRATR